ncbi:MAG: hypothetical protein ABI863_15510 [Ginsengibacter sp.]
MSKSKNSRVVVVYLDDDSYQFHMFKMFLKSIKLINAKDTDIVIFYEPRYESLFSSYGNTSIGNNQAGLIFKKMVPPVFQNTGFQDYKYVNSIACLIGQNWLLDYKYILRTDVDTVLTPRWNSIYPDCFTTGSGLYNNDINTKVRLQKVMERLKLPQRKDYSYNIGSTWYGPSSEVIDTATLSSKIVKDLLFNDFKSFVGKWPGFFRDVCSLYSGEIAVNYLIKNFKIDSNNFDFDSTSSDSVFHHAHIHCWHTVKLFSKHAFFDGKYKNTDVKKLDRNVINQYCLFCALTGEI